MDSFPCRKLRYLYLVKVIENIRQGRLLVNSMQALHYILGTPRLNGLAIALLLSSSSSSSSFFFFFFFLLLLLLMLLLFSAFPDSDILGTFNMPIDVGACKIILSYNIEHNLVQLLLDTITAVTNENGIRGLGFWVVVVSLFLSFF
jgi:hypothetical protein